MKLAKVKLINWMNGSNPISKLLFLWVLSHIYKTSISVRWKKKKKLCIRVRACISNLWPAIKYAIISLCSHQRIMSRVCLLIRFVVLLAVPAAAWKFKILGLDEDRILITRIAVYGVRAFLAVPRLYNEQPYTLIEVPWPERSLYTIYSPKAFPSGQAQVCLHLQSLPTSAEFASWIGLLDGYPMYNLP